jgi:hypothetical protein
MTTAINRKKSRPFMPMGGMNIGFPYASPGHFALDFRRQSQTKRGAFSHPVTLSG